MINEVKRKAVLLTKRLFHHLGFMIVRIPKANELFDELSHAPTEVQKYRIKRLARNVRIANNQKLYNNLLKKYVPKWNNEFTRTEFIGYGIGEYNLCVYRKVCYEGKYYLEKVYFNLSVDLLKVEWFYEYIYPILKNSLNIPKIHKIVRGDLITIVYFEFIDLVSLPRNVWYSVFFNFSRRMIVLSKSFEKLSSDAPWFIKDYTLHDYYKKSIKVGDKTIKRLSDNKLTSKMIERIINLQPLIFTHGDIHDRNVFAENYIIDWDSIGFFPLGFESAVILVNNPRYLTFKALHEVLIEEYKVVIHKDRWEYFELSCMYFYILFSVNFENNISNIELQKDVFNRIEILYDKTSWPEVNKY